MNDDLSVEIGEGGFEEKGVAVGGDDVGDYAAVGGE